MVKAEDLSRARAETVRYHQSYYRQHQLFEAGSWLSEPDREVLALIERLKHRIDIRVLDIGCGVGRNAIPIAKALKHCGVMVQCVDMLEESIDRLVENAKQHEVAEQIEPLVADMDALSINADFFDVVLAISALEHSRSYDKMVETIELIKMGTKSGGINRLTFSTNRRINDAQTGEDVATFVETPLERESLMALLRAAYGSWTIEKLYFEPYCEELTIDGRTVVWRCEDINFLAVRP